LICIYIAVEYFQTARLSQMISFQAWDGPGPMPKSRYPEPFGNHFFGDFLLQFRMAQLASPYFAEGFVPFSYFPLAAVLLGPFILFEYWLALVLFLVTGMTTTYFICRRGLRDLTTKQRNQIILLVFVSGPMFSAIDRGNLSLILTAICIAGVFQLREEKLFVSAILFGIAGAIKGYPCLFLLIFLRRREWKPLLAGSLAFVMSMNLPLMFYEKGYLKNLKEMISQFAGSSTTAHAIKIRAYNNSLLAFFDTCRTSVGGRFSDFFLFLENHYSICGIVLMSILLLFAVSKYSSDLQSLLLITVVVCVIPQTVGYYVLLLYFVPLLFLWADAERMSLSTKLILVALAIIMIPKGFPIWLPANIWTPAAATYTSLLNPLCGIVIAVTCMSDVIRQRSSLISKEKL